MRYRILDDGTLVFPKNGLPPMELNGYVQDPGDPYVFTPIVPDCVHRTQRNSCLPCGTHIMKAFCLKLELFVTPKHCSECVLEKK